MHDSAPRRRGLTVTALTAGLLTACNATAPAPAASRAHTSSPTARALTDPLAGCPATVALSSLQVFARVAGDDDDLAVTPGGAVWMSQPGDGHVVQLDARGATLRTFNDPNLPEGIVVTPDGRVLVAEQRTNRVVALDPSSGGRPTVFAAPGRAGLNTGIDGLALDTARGTLLIPDSPQGSLLALPVGGGAAVTLATYLGRPVSAAALPDGTLLVAEENSPGLVAVSTTGSVSPAAAPGALQSVDEVLVRGSLAYVADLLAGTIDAVDVTTGRVRVLVDGAPAPQGLAVLPDGRLLVSDSTRHVLATMASCR